LWFDEKKDFGFIRTEDEERLYIHRSGFSPGPAPVGRCAGLEVVFERTFVDGVAQAVGASIAEPSEPPRRARRRRQHG